MTCRAQDTKRRWITIQGVSHVLHERDGAWMTKLCGGITTEGTVSHARTSEIANVCPLCAAKMTEHIFVGREDGKADKRPMKTSGRRRKIPRSY